MVDFASVDALAADYHRRGAQPGMAYGIVLDGELVHAGGLGERRLGGAPPDADTVFRIASMTKSFTASAILMLRDEGALALDEQAGKYVPEMRGWPLVTPDAAPVSIRQLLTMTAGFPTDDPWGDRQQGLPLDEFAEFLAGGVSFAWAPGTRFEYSNLGYAILGRVITAVSGTPPMKYPDFIVEKLMRPLGMTRSGYEAAELAGDAQACGYRRAPDGWTEVALDPYGAFAPMGGVFSCVSDLARWVAGFAAAFPPGAGPAASHPLRAASRREMQMAQVLTGLDRVTSFPVPRACLGYGFGLFVDEDRVFGRLVGHSGGYPGFGSYMRWHPATGAGVVALGNGTYAPVAPLAARLLDTVLRQMQAPAGGYALALAPARQVGSAGSAGPAGKARPETLAARDAVNRLLANWDDTAAAALFTENVAQDIPFAERRRAIGLIRERIGEFSDDPGRPPVCDSPAQCRWWIAGERGAVQVQILLTPERRSRVQSMTLAVPPADGSPLREVLDGTIAWLNGGPPVPATAEVDVDLLTRRLRAAAAWAGTCRIAAYRAGDGATTATVDLAGEHATLILTVAADPATTHLRHADLML